MPRSRPRVAVGRPRRRAGRWLIAAAVAYAAARGAHGALRPLPPGFGVAGPLHPAEAVTFLADTTTVSPAPGAAAARAASEAAPPPGRLPDGWERQVEQHIFDAVFDLIDGARQGVVVDMFLYNRWQGARPERTRALTEQLTEHLVAKRRAIPSADVVLLTDPINTVYGSAASPDLDALRAAGVTVVITDLTRLPDSNPLWSGPWRAFIAPLGTAGRGWLPNPFAPDGPRVTARAWFALFNFKANHRKVAIADTPDGPAAIVTSANPHNGSSAHGNVALKVRGPVVADLIESERAVAALSGVALPAMAWASPTPAAEAAGDAPPPGAPRVGLLTEQAIRDAVVATLDGAGRGDRVDVAVFYLAHRGVIAALVAAADRGAAVRVLLDPNKDAFGRTKNGVPNRPVAAELRRRGGIDVRWCDTHGEQCHAKLVLVRRADGTATLNLGSANLTRRNIDGLNLETNLVVEAAHDAPVIADAVAAFERAWSNAGGRVFSADYGAYAEDGWFKRVLYRVMEATGLSTF